MDNNGWIISGPPSANSGFARVFPQQEADGGTIPVIYEVNAEYPTWCIDTNSPVLIRSSITDGTYLS